MAIFNAGDVTCEGDSLWLQALTLCLLTLYAKTGSSMSKPVSLNGRSDLCVGSQALQGQKETLRFPRCCKETKAHTHKHLWSRKLDWVLQVLLRAIRIAWIWTHGQMTSGYGRRAQNGVAQKPKSKGHERNCGTLHPEGLIFSSHTHNSQLFFWVLLIMCSNFGCAGWQVLQAWRDSRPKCGWRHRDRGDLELNWNGQKSTFCMKPTEQFAAAQHWKEFLRSKRS